MTTALMIEERNLSRAWAKAFLSVAAPGSSELAPLVVTVTGFAHDQPLELHPIRHALDAALLQANKFSCHTVANTIFPQSLWNPQQGRAALFERYRRIAPRLKRMDRHNQYGLYFDRLIAFGPNDVNQLEHIVQTYHQGNHRRTALQVSTFDPHMDHTHQRQRGFPCLQQVAFAPSADGGLAITAFYARQHLFERAYGNYLGLCDLGQFVAHELGLHLTRMTCMASVAALGGTTKRAVQPLVQELQLFLHDTSVNPEQHGASKEDVYVTTRQTFRI